MAKIYAVSSGKGGVGKSTIALSLAVAAAKRGKRTILLDASGISRSCDLALGMESVVVLDLADVCCQQTSLESTLYQVPQYENLSFVCASLYDNVPIGEFNSVLLALLVIRCHRTGCSLIDAVRVEPFHCFLLQSVPLAPQTRCYRPLEYNRLTCSPTSSQRF